MIPSFETCDPVEKSESFAFAEQWDLHSKRSSFPIYVYVYVLDAYVMVRRAAPPHMARTRDGEHDDDDAYAVCVFVCDRS